MGKSKNLPHFILLRTFIKQFKYVKEVYMIEFINMDKISSKDILKVIHMKNDEGEDRSINIIKNGDDKVSISINIHRYMTDEEGFRVDLVLWIIY